MPLLNEKDLAAFTNEDYYVKGKSYHFVLTHGWCIVGYFIDFPDPFTLRIAHASYYRSAGKQTHSQLVQNGPNADTDWEYWGTILVSRPHIISREDYNHEVHIPEKK